MEQIAQYTIIGLFLIGSVIGIKYVRGYFSKKDRYRDSVSASRKQNDLIGRREKR